MLVTLRGRGLITKASILILMKQFMQIQIFFLHRENKLEPDINSYTALLVVHAEAGNVEGIMEVRNCV